MFFELYENVNYFFNNYTNLIDNDLNANPPQNDPGINPKYLLIIIKRFIINQNLKKEYVIDFIKYIFRVFDSNRNYYSFSIMIIDFLIELFSNYLREYISYFKKGILSLMDWIKQYPIPPTMYRAWTYPAPEGVKIPRADRTGPYPYRRG